MLSMLTIHPNEGPPEPQRTVSARGYRPLPWCDGVHINVRRRNAGFVAA